MATADKRWNLPGTALAAAALLGSLALPAAAQTARNAGYVPPQTNRTTVTTGTYVYTGPVSRASGGSVTVNHNGILRPTYVLGDTAVVRNGRHISASRLRRGETVRVTAVQVSPNRWEARRIDVVKPQVARARVGSGDRVSRVYTEERITSRSRFGGADRSAIADAPFSGMGVVESVNGDEQSFRMRIGKNTRRVYAEFAGIAGVTRIRDLKKGDRVRVVGGLYGRDVLADRVHMLD